MTNHARKPTNERASVRLDQLNGWLNDPCRARIPFAVTPAGDIAYFSPMPPNIRAIMDNLDVRQVQSCPSCDHAPGTSLELVEFDREAWPDYPTDREVS